MTYQVELTQKKNGTFLADARPVTTSDATQDALKANPYRDADSFRATLKGARLASETKSALEQAATEAEARPEIPVSRTVADVDSDSLRTIGLN